MNSDQLAAYFEGGVNDVLGPASALATAPLLILAIGILLKLLADIVPAARSLNPAIFVGTLLSAFFAQLAIYQKEPGTVLWGSYLADHTTALWGMIFLIGTLLAWAYSIGYYRAEHRPFKAEHDVLMLSACTGMTMMACAQDLLVFFVGLELLSIPLYALAAFRRNRSDSVEAGLKYFLLGAFAAAFFVYGSALIYAGTGTISLTELRQMGLATPLALSGVALLTASVFFKISVFPFQMWVPDVYEGSPTPVTALMATGTKAAAFAFLIHASFLLPAQAATTIAVVALITMALGNLGALSQVSLKRLLAYSGIAHAGTVLLVVAGSLAGDTEPTGAMQAALFYMGAYLFTSTGAFGLLSQLESEDEGNLRIDNLRGLSRRRPAVAAALALFLLSLGGIPATGGFLGKWFVFSVLVRADMFAVAVLGVLLSVVALAYYLRIVVVMYMQPAPEGEQAGAPTPRGGSFAGNLATAVCAVLVLAMGVLPGWFLDKL